MNQKTETHHPVKQDIKNNSERFKFS